jgi:hypothetical protein
MAAHTSETLADGHTLTVTSHVVTDLALRPYVEYRLEERDALGSFVGFLAFGSREFVEAAKSMREFLAGRDG